MFRLRQWPGSRSQPSVFAQGLGHQASTKVAEGNTFDYGLAVPNVQLVEGGARLVVDGFTTRSDESFDSWPTGALTANTSYGTQGWGTSTGATVSGVASPWAGNAVQVTTAASGTITNSTAQGARWRWRFYYKASAVPTATHYFGRAAISGTTHLWFAVTTAGQIQLRNSAFTAPTYGQSLYRITAGAELRVEVVWDANIGARMELFYGSNLHGTGPSEVLYHQISDTAGLAGLGAFNQFFLGNNGSGDGVTATFDAVEITTGDSPGPLATVWSGWTILPAVSSLSATGDSAPAGGGTVTGAAALSASSSLSADSLRLNTLAGIANSTAVTTGNSGASSGDVFQTVVGAPTVKTSANLTSAYDRGFEATVASATDSYVQWEFPGGVTTTTGFVRLYVRIGSLPPGTLRLFRATSSGGTIRWDIRITTSGRFVMTNQAGGTITQTADAVATTGTVWRVEAGVSGTTGELRVYEGESTTPLSTTNIDPATDLGWDRVRFGAMFSAAQSYTVEVAAPAHSHTRWVGAAAPPTVTGAATLTATSTLAADSIWLNGLTGISNGTAVTTGNSGGSSGDAFSSIGGTAPTVRTSANLTSAYDRGMEAAVASATDSFAQWIFPGGDTTKGFVRLYVRISSLPPSTLYLARGADSSGSVRWDVRITTTGQVVLANAGGGWIDQTSTGVIATNTVYRLEASIDGYSGELRVYEGEGTAPLSVTTLEDASNLGWDRVRIGAMFSAARTFTAEVAAPAFSHTRWVGRAATSSTVTGAAALAATSSLSCAASVGVVAASLRAGSSSLTAAGSVTQQAAAAFAASSSLAAVGQVNVQGASLRAGVSTLAAAGAVTQKASAALSGVSSLSATGTRGVPGSVALTASTSLSAASVLTVPAASLRAGASTLTVAGAVTQQASAAFAASSSLAAVGGRSVSGSAALGSSSVQTVQGAVTVRAASVLAASSSLAADGTRIGGTVSGAANLSGAGGGLAAVASVNVQGATLRAGQSTLSAVGTRGVPASAALGAVSLVEVQALVRVGAAAALAGSSGVAPEGKRALPGAAVLAAQSWLTAAASIVAFGDFYVWDGSQYRAAKSVQVKQGVGWTEVTSLRIKTESGWQAIL